MCVHAYYRLVLAPPLLSTKGLFLAGSLRVSRYHPRDEAFLTPHPSSLTSHPSQVAQGDVLIWGSDSRCVCVCVCACVCVCVSVCVCV